MNRSDNELSIYSISHTLVGATSTCTRNLLVKKKFVLGIVIALSILMISHNGTPTKEVKPKQEKVKKPENLDYIVLQTEKHKPREIIIKPGEAATNVTRYEALNDFSKHKYIETATKLAATKTSKWKTKGLLESPLNITTGNNINGRKSMDRRQQDCKPILCNKGICFENMLCYKLPKFLPQFKNPCFNEEVTQDDSDQNVYKNYIIRRMVPNVEVPAVQKFHHNWQKRRNSTKTQLRCLPYFFIIGMEKCGTTDLYQRINMHPEVALSMAKEVQWWTRRRFFYSVNNSFPGKLQSDENKLENINELVNVPFKHYYSFFDNVADQIGSASLSYGNGTAFHSRITGDGSPNTMYWNDFRTIFSVNNSGTGDLVAHHIAATLPKAKIIAILRNPVDRLYSSYLFFNSGATKAKFHQIVTRGIALLKLCVSKNSLKYCVYDPELKRKVGSTVNIMQGLYTVMLEDWLQAFPRSQLHVVHFESYTKSELTSINKIFEFLGLYTVTKNDHVGKRIILKEKVFGGKQYARAGSMMFKTRNALEEFYQPYNNRLAALLDDDRFTWAKSLS